MKTEYQQLSVKDREKIAIFRAQGRSIRAIAKELGRHHATIIREITRNGTPIEDDYYLPSQANEKARTRKQEAGKRKRLKSETIRLYVEAKLNVGWSPEQIAGRISMDIPATTISHEAIYQYIYFEALYLRGCLARKHRKRLPKRYSRKHRRSHIPNRIMIDDRPLSVNRRKEFGHWEADSIVSQADRSRLNVLVERKSRFVQITKMDNGSPSSTRLAIQQRLLPLPKYARRSITYDNGFENLEHELINQTLETNSYFCHPFHSWEKGSVENIAGLIRRFIRKGIEIGPLQDRFIHRIEFLLNNRPRKCLEFHTPLELFSYLGGALPR